MATFDPEAPNDEAELFQLYVRIKPARNAAQIDFVDAWELADSLASDGFECLPEQERPLMEFANFSPEWDFRKQIRFSKWCG